MRKIDELVELAERLGAEIIKVGKEVRRVEQTTDATGEPAKRIIKSMVLISDRGPILAILDGESKIDLKKLREEFGKLRFATPKEVEEISGFEAGGVPPIGIEIRTVIDDRILEEEYVIGGGGRPDWLLKINPKKIVEVQRAEVRRIRRRGSLLLYYPREQY